MSLFIGLSTRTAPGLRVFFEPRSVAVVGASRTPGKFGHTVVRNLVRLGFRGRVFPVNPRATEIEGLPAYPSTRDIPEEVDLAVLALPADQTVQAVRDCAAKGIKGAVIISSGFDEAGEEGKERQRAISQIAAQSHMRLLGPNTTGVLNTQNMFITTFIPFEKVRPGPVAFIAQTGMFTGMLLERIVTGENFGVSKVIGLGNKADIQDHEALDYLAEDELTRVVMMHIEGLKDGPSFLRAAARITRKKPVIALKSGRTEEGARAALSHSASLVGRDEVVEAAFRQTGVIRVDDFEDLLHLAKTFAFQPLPRGNRVGLISLSGAAGVLGADLCAWKGLALARLQPETLRDLQERMPSWARASHPLDLEPLTETLGHDAACRRGLELLLADPGVDACLFIQGTIQREAIDPSFFTHLKKAFPDKPLAVCIMGRKNAYDEWSRGLEGAGIPVFPSVRPAVESLAALWRYRRFLNTA